MTKELELWKGQFGNDYTDRNIPSETDIQNRVQLWGNCIVHGSDYMPGPWPPKSFLEVGAGVGANMMAIKNIYERYNTPVELYAIEPNERARRQLISNAPVCAIGKSALEIELDDCQVDVSFTSGVLIHIHPDDQLTAMKEIYRVTKRRIVCIEYFSPELREVNYHGHKALWTRDYGSFWLDNFKLHCVSSCFYWKRISGLDNVTAWVFEKVN